MKIWWKKVGEWEPGDFCAFWPRNGNPDRRLLKAGLAVIDFTTYHNMKSVFSGVSKFMSWSWWKKERVEKRINDLGRSSGATFLHSETVFNSSHVPPPSQRHPTQIPLQWYPRQLQLDRFSNSGHIRYAQLQFCTERALQTIRQSVAHNATTALLRTVYSRLKLQLEDLI